MRFITSGIIAGFVLAASAASAADPYALTTPVRPQFELTTALSERLDIRLGFSQSPAEGYDPGMAAGSGGLKPLSASALVDWEFAPGGFRLTGGALYGRPGWATGLAADGISGTAPMDWDNTYLDDSTSDNLTPYVGVGWGSGFSSGGRFGLQFDMGLMIENGDTRGYTAAGLPGTSELDPGAPASLVTEDEFEGLRYTPMISADFYFRF